MKLYKITACSYCGEPVGKWQRSITVYDIITGRIKAILHHECIKAWRGRR